MKTKIPDMNNRPMMACFHFDLVGTNCCLDGERCGFRRVENPSILIDEMGKNVLTGQGMERCPNFSVAVPR